MMCYKGIKFVNKIGTTWTAEEHIREDEWVFISNTGKRQIYTFDSFYKGALGMKWEIVNKFKHYLDKL